MLNAHPGLIGLGIDERTAVLIECRGVSWSVIGQSYAVVCLPSQRDFPRIEVLKPGDRADIEMLKHNPGIYAITSPGELDDLLGTP